MNSWYTANTNNGQGLIIEEGTGNNIAVSYDEKDVNLIAAAPELLKVAKLLAEWDQSNDDPVLISKACSLARAAIVKAERIK